MKSYRKHNRKVYFIPMDSGRFMIEVSERPSKGAPYNPLPVYRKTWDTEAEAEAEWREIINGLEAVPSLCEYRNIIELLRLAHDMGV